MNKTNSDALSQSIVNSLISFRGQFSINELEQKTLDQNIFSSSPQCPANRNFSLWAVSYDFSFERICDALDKLSYLVMAISVLLSVNIILRK